ncbi:CoA pyrophosphatase, partial [Brevibacterium paucivorans]
EALSGLAQSDISDHWIHHRRPKQDDSVRPAAVLML